MKGPKGNDLVAVNVHWGWGACSVVAPAPVAGRRLPHLGAGSGEYPVSAFSRAEVRRG